MKNVAAMISLILISGCASYGRSVELPIPVKPAWEKLSHKNYQCLDINQWSNLRDRSALRDGYERELIGILKSTHD